MTSGIVTIASTKSAMEENSHAVSSGIVNSSQWRTKMTNDAFVAFWTGMMAGAVIGIFIFSVVLAIIIDKRDQEESK